MRAIQITEFGGPEVLTLTDLPEPVAGEGSTLVDVTSAGINFADTHQAEDSYLAPQTLPLVPGAEVVGTRRSDGRRVVALLAGGGGYAEVAAAPDAVTFELPDEVSDSAALALVLQGTTAWHLLRTSAHLAAGETVVVHSAAGGVGSIAVQLAHQWGAGRVIATASSEDKRHLALDLGADVAVDTSACQDAAGVAALLRDANDGRGVDVVLEMTGGHVLDGSLERPRAVRPGRRVRDGVPYGAEGGAPRRADVHLAGAHRLLAGAHAASTRRPAPRDGRAALPGEGRPARTRGGRHLPARRGRAGAPRHPLAGHPRQARPRRPPLTRSRRAPRARTNRVRPRRPPR